MWAEGLELVNAEVGLGLRVWNWLMVVSGSGRSSSDLRREVEGTKLRIHPQPHKEFG